MLACRPQALEHLGRGLADLVGHFFAPSLRFVFFFAPGLRFVLFLLLACDLSFFLILAFDLSFFFCSFFSGFVIKMSLSISFCDGFFKGIK